MTTFVTEARAEIQHMRDIDYAFEDGEPVGRDGARRLARLAELRASIESRHVPHADSFCCGTARPALAH